MSDEKPAGYWITPPIQSFIGLEIQPGEHNAKLELPLTDRVSGWGPVHGGVLALLADTCCAVAVMTVVDGKRELPASTDLHVRYFKQPREGPLRAEGVVVNRGSKSVAAECEIRDGQDRLIAKATGSYTLFEIDKRTDIRPPE